MSLTSLRVPAAAVLLSLLFRAIYFLQIRDNPFFDAPVMDEGYHDGWAREIASGDWTARVPFFRAPLYPMLLGLGYRLFGPDFDVLRGLQLVLGAITPALVWVLARRLVPERPAVAAVTAFAVALDGILVYFEADLLLESLLAPLGTLLVLLVLRAGETGSVVRWGVAGLVLGLFAITRPNILLFAPVAFAFALAWRGETLSIARPRKGAALAITAGTCLLVLPVTWVNARVGGDPVLVASQGGLNFFLGNNPEANGWSATAPSLFRIDWWGGYEDAIRLAEEARGRELAPSEVSDYWFSRGFDWWREHPGRALVLTLKKTVFFFSGMEFGNNRHVELFFREYAPVAIPSLYLLWAVVPLALLGIVRLLARGDAASRVAVLFLLVYTISVVLFFVTARYRVPVRPLLFLCATYGAFVVADVWRRNRAAGIALGVSIALTSLALNRNPWMAEYAPSRAQFYQSVANVHHDQGRLAEAFASQQRALEVDPTYPKGNLNLGTLLMAMGNPRGAVEAFERERALDPSDGQNLASLAQAYNVIGRVAEAERAYAAAEEAGLVDARALYNHGVILERLGRPEKAEELYRRAVAADPAFADGWNNLGVLAAKAGRLEEAIPLWERALEARPGHPGAGENLERARGQLGAARNGEQIREER